MPYDGKYAPVVTNFYCGAHGTQKEPACRGCFDDACEGYAAATVKINRLKEALDIAWPYVPSDRRDEVEDLLAAASKVPV